MNESFVLQDEREHIDSDRRHRICYPSKYADGVYDIYYSRYKLYKTYYNNLKSNGIDLMVA